MTDLEKKVVGVFKEAINLLADKMFNKGDPVKISICDVIRTNSGILWVGDRVWVDGSFVAAARDPRGISDSSIWKKVLAKDILAVQFNGKGYWYNIKWDQSSKQYLFCEMRGEITI